SSGSRVADRRRATGVVRPSRDAGTVPPMSGSPVLDQFSPAVRAWFETSFPEPTAPQVAGWPTIASGAHTLILAPTGSGKTLSAFLWAIDRLTSTSPPEERTHRTRVVYLSPLRALAVDVEKNLRAPI